jgi:AcrR family transcriptional regulator
MASRGRRPGDQDTRETILATARSMFIEQGFTKATVTGMARRAEVDAALIYHYFGSKVELFVESMAASREFQQQAADAPLRAARSGVEIVAGFLRNWERDAEAPGRAFVAVAQAVSSFPDAAARVNQFVVERIWKRGELVGKAVDEEEAVRRASMVGSQLVGIAFARYILRLEPLASAPIDEVAAWYGPTIDGYKGQGSVPVSG